MKSPSRSTSHRKVSSDSSTELKTPWISRNGTYKSSELFNFDSAGFYSINELVEFELFAGGFEKVDAKMLGLDPRAGDVLISDDAIAIEKRCTEKFDYYSGFEYVDESCVRTFGDWKIYSSKDTRVSDAIDFYRYCQ